MINVLVTGGRDYADHKLVNKILDEIHATRGIRVIIQGGARGADRLAHQWAEANGIPSISHFANWTKHRKAAGPIRNRAMYNMWPCDLVVAFPGGTGTADMCKVAADKEKLIID